MFLFAAQIVQIVRLKPQLAGFLMQADQFISLLAPLVLSSIKLIMDDRKDLPPPQLGLLKTSLGLCSLLHQFIERRSQRGKFGKSLLPLFQHRKPLGDRRRIEDHPLQRAVFLTKAFIKAGANFRNNQLLEQILVREGIIFLKIALDSAFFAVDFLHITPLTDMNIPLLQEVVIFLEFRIAAAERDNLPAALAHKLLDRVKTRWSVF
ncbi:hypothetical protein D3C75_706830 [compost metagenome]